MNDRVAKDAKEYREVWERHIDDFALLALRARIDYDEYRLVKNQLNAWLKKAIENTQGVNHE